MAPTDFLDAVDAPIIEKIGGVDVTFPVLDEDDLIEILTANRAKDVAALQEQCDEAKVEPQARAYMLAKERRKPLHPYNAHDYFVQDVDGTRWCLLRSLKKGGMTEAAAKAVLGKMYGDQKRALAARVAHIIEPRSVAAAATAAAKAANKTLGMGDAGQVAPKQPVGMGETPANPPAPGASVSTT